jgi:phosphopantothenoylcysteine decarboxylase/phosphopantothenate--cysteine ligase
VAKPSKPRSPRRVVLGITGSIAAYKACLIVRGLVKAGAEVRCILTESAEKFVSPLTLTTLSRHPVCLDMFDRSHWDMAHLSFASWAERVLLAPATAETIARLAQGRAGTPIDATVLATKAPVAVAPAMDADMWAHPATRANVARLREYGYAIWGPVSGQLASGREGPGCLMDPDEIVRRVLAG